ncbi:hypothetical protein TNCT_338801 [Trichonephila clavata]|uniref:Uncharacterized protein n=1 Tax=Trichonephila clavata TaxID=2740835 RepID=A0A8X6L9D4_TRICU|nr:hypothetical protein TNCT_338801 [Trichonephila clavata]
MDACAASHQTKVYFMTKTIRNLTGQISKFSCERSHWSRTRPRARVFTLLVSVEPGVRTSVTAKIYKLKELSDLKSVLWELDVFVWEFRVFPII